MSQDQLLGYHAAEGHTDDLGIWPTQMIHQPRRIVGIVGHGVTHVGLVGTTQAPLVIGNHVKALGQGAIHLVGLVAQICASARDE